MRKLLVFMTMAALLSVTACYDEADVAKPEVQTKAATPQFLVNNSTIFRVDLINGPALQGAVWTTSINELQVLTRFTVTPATVISLNGRLAPLGALKAGDVVCIFYTNDPNCMTGLICRTAHRIIATRRV
jgi:hypothetical protein